MKISTCCSGFISIELIEDNEICTPGFLLMGLSRVSRDYALPTSGSGFGIFHVFGGRGRDGSW